jgi:type IV pilus assembly protein PilM
MKIVNVRRLVGIDIRQNFIRLVELSYINAKYKVEACINAPLAQAKITDEIVVATIKDILSKNSLKSDETAIALSHNEVIFKEFKITAGLSHKEIKKFLGFNFSRLSGEKAEDFVIDYAIDAGGITDKMVKLQTVGVKTNITARLASLLHKAKLELCVIDVDIYALERAIRFQLGPVLGLTAVVNIDYNQILIIVFDDKKVIYFHEDNVDEDDFSTSDQVPDLIKSKLHVAGSSLTGSFARIVIGGEKARLPRLVDEIKSRVDLPIILAAPFSNMELSESICRESIAQLSPLMLISCGLALRVKDHG